MRLVTFDAGGGPRLGGVVRDPGAERIIDLTAALGAAGASMQALVDAGRGALARAHDTLAAAGQGDGMPLEAVRLAAPLRRPPTIVAVGRNYREHAAEEGAALPSDPVLFTKYSSSVVGPGAAIRWRAEDARQVDYEAELGVVIGSVTRDVPPERALEAVFGYTCLNDVSARDLQVRDGQWVRAKSLDTFCPMGPWIVTRDAIADPMRLTIRCTVNGELRQDATTAELVHGVAELIAFCSRYFTLHPGDVIATGTPGGVGAFRVPPVFLADGDVVTVWIEGIGSLTNRCEILDA